MKPVRIKPKPGQESVWDYPRPPRVAECHKHIRVIFKRVTLADTRRAIRVLETSHPPVYYLPPQDIGMEYLTRAPGASFCEWKGTAQYYNVGVGEPRAERAAWCYPAPMPGFAALAGYVAFYAGLLDACYVDDELVMPQPGGFYGGWITADIVGPFKGEPGAADW